MYKIRPSVKFQKDLKRLQRRGYNLPLLTDILKLLATYSLTLFGDKSHLANPMVSLTKANPSVPLSSAVRPQMQV